jgi:hypothetical protein
MEHKKPTAPPPLMLEWRCSRCERLEGTCHCRAIHTAQLLLVVIFGVLFIARLLTREARADVAFLAAPITRHPAGHPQAGTVNNSFTQSVSINSGPYAIHPEAQLIVRTPAGAERVLVPKGAVDFSIERLGRTALVTISENNQTDIWRLTIATGELQRITNTPNVWEVQPVDLINGRIAYLSNEDNWRNPKAPYVAFTVYSSNKDGGEKQRLWHAGLGGVFGLFFGSDGRLYFTSGENQGVKNPAAAGMHWPIWSINPDASEFNPESSYASRDQSFQPPADWPVITTDGSLVYSIYYNTRIYGTLAVAPKFVPGIGAPPSQWDHPLWTAQPGIPMGYDRQGGGDTKDYWGYLRRGTQMLRWATHADYENKNPQGEKPGMVSHPFPVPNNGVYVTWTGDQGDQQANLGVYAIKDVKALPATHKEMVKVVDEPGRHEWMGKEVCSFEAIYGFAEAPDRAAQNTIVSSNATSLPAGSPYGVVTSASVDLAEVPKMAPQFSDAAMVPVPGDSAAFLRILSFNPTTPGDGNNYEITRNGNPYYEQFANWDGFYSQGNERMGFYVPDVPLQKFRTSDGKLHMGPNPPAGSERIKRADGRPDTSFRFEIPGNQPWTFQLLNSRKEALHLFTAETWHQVIPGEYRTCGGCHNHHAPDSVEVKDTVAGSSEYPSYRLKTIRTVVYERDIAPLNLGIEQRPWNRKDANQHVAFNDSLTRNMPASPAQELVAAWQGTMFMAAGKYKGALIQPSSNRGPYADLVDPTVKVTPTATALIVGMADPQAGLDLSSFKVTVDGQDVTSGFTANQEQGIWTRPGIVSGTVVARVKDLHGNETVIEKIVSLPPPPPVEEKPTAAFVAFDLDKVGPQRQNTPNGVMDYHVRINGMRKSRNPLFVDIKATVGGVTHTWGDRAVGETPENPAGTSWIISMQPRLAPDAAGGMDVTFEPVPGFVPDKCRIYLNYTEQGTSGVLGVDYDAILAIPLPPPPAPPPADDVAALKAKIAELTAQIATLTAERDALKQQGTTDAAAIAKLNSDIASLKADVAALADQIKARVK